MLSSSSSTETNSTSALNSLDQSVNLQSLSALHGGGGVFVPGGGGVVAAPINDFSWSDGDTKVQIYIDLPGINNAGSTMTPTKITLDYTPTSFCLIVHNFNDGLLRTNLRLLKNDLYAEVIGAIFKTSTKKERITVVLYKKGTSAWPSLTSEPPNFA